MARAAIAGRPALPGGLCAGGTPALPGRHFGDPLRITPPLPAKPLSSGPSSFFVALVDFFFLAFVVLGGSDQRNAMGRMVKPAVLPLILLVAAM